MSQPRDTTKQKRIRVFSVSYDATLKDATEEDPDRVAHAGGSVNVERDDLEDAVAHAKKVVRRLYTDREVIGVSIVGISVVVEVTVET